MSRNSAAMEAIQAELVFDKNSLDDAVIKQPQLMWEATRELAGAHKVAAALERDKANLTAELDKLYRREAEDNQQKMTETALVLRIRDSAQMRDLNEEIIEARYVAELWAGLVESLRARGSSLREAGELYRTNYFSRESISGGNPAEMNVVKNAEAAEVRKDLGRRRRAMRASREET